MQKAYVIQVDSREQLPFRFPRHLAVSRPFWPGQPHRIERVRLEVVKATLQAGDYSLLGYEKATIVERKWSLSELATNCFSADRERFLRALRRLRDTAAWPVLVLDGGLDKYLKADRHVDAPPEAALDEVQRLCDRLRIRLQLLPGGTARQRLLAGEWVARTLVNGAIEFDDTPALHGGLENGVPQQ